MTISSHPTNVINGQWTDTILSDFDQKRCHTYPHCNGFADGGRSIVLAQAEPEHHSLWKCDLETGTETFIRRFPGSVSWIDVAMEANFLTVEAEHAVWLFDLDHPDEGRIVCRQRDGIEFLGMPSITADGSNILVQFRREGLPENHRGTMIIDSASGESQIIFEHDWWANHTHFSPHDPAWVIYCHEGKCDLIPDRIWAWHAQHAPKGLCMFDQASDVPGKFLNVGHEVACTHDASLLVVAYGVSPAGPRGLYEVFFDGREPRLVSEGDRDLHCQPSRCGRWAVVDTTGPHDAPGLGWENSHGISDILLVDMQTGERSHLARSRITEHPWHPHPAFSPDGQRIIYSEASAEDPALGRLHLLERVGSRAHARLARSAKFA